MDRLFAACEAASRSQEACRQDSNSGADAEKAPGSAQDVNQFVHMRVSLMSISRCVTCAFVTLHKPKGLRRQA